MLAVVFPAETSFHDPVQRQLVQARREIDEKEQTEQCGNSGTWGPLAAARPGFRLVVHGLASGGDSASAGTASDHVLLNVARLLWQSSWPGYLNSLGYPERLLNQSRKLAVDRLSFHVLAELTGV